MFVQRVCQDKVFPLIHFFAKGGGRSGTEPIRGYILTLVIAIGCIAIGKFPCKQHSNYDSRRLSLLIICTCTCICMCDVCVYQSCGSWEVGGNSTLHFLMLILLSFVVN